ncbi:MAG: helix-turn-helix domain-containing protein [Burkholderiales bacterium]|nr:MAG: helix-turn-helix domain-containing protein [Burkholderiales bacterium]
MSEEELPIRFADTAQASLDAAKTAGQLMYEAREAQGLHVAALAVALKVPVKKLEALEADRLEELPDAVFVRALASSVCRALKIDPTPVLAKLPQLNTRVLDQVESGMNVSFRTRSDGPSPSALANLSRPAVMGVLALLLGAIILIFLPDFTSRSATKSTDVSSAAQANNSGVSLGNPANVPSLPAEKVGDAATSVVSASVSANSAAPATLMVTPSLSTPSVGSPTLTVTPLAADALPLPADSVVVFAAIGESWIEVKDAGGRIILQRTLQNGEKAGAGPSMGKLPYSVIVGRSNLTQVTVRHKAFDLAPVSSKDAVARFQVK